MRFYNFVLSLFLALGFATTASAKTDVFGNFTLTSETVKDGGTMPKSTVFKGFGCSGDNLSPQLTWKGAPEGTRSYAITMYDPDAPTGSGWWHWGVYNIPLETNSLEEGASKTGANKAPFFAKEMFTDFGSTGYGGPCPPEGDKPHHYIITVYALKVDKLELDASTTTGAMLAFVLRDNAIAKTSITGTFGR